MLNRTRRSCWLMMFIIMALNLAFLSQPCKALGPDSPEVKKMLEKSLKYLETANIERFGGKCLVGLVFVKQGHDENHAQVKLAVDECVRLAKAEPENIKTPVYDLGIAVIFLCNLDPSKYQEEIRKFLKALEIQQKKHGGWGYLDKETGDTSMTQYGALSAWEAVKVGFTVPRETIESMTDWLIRTQDPTGGWGYQGKVPDTTTGRVKQDRVTLCLTTAALGCTYVAGDLLGIATTTPKNEDPNLPPALIPIRKELQPAKDDAGAVDPKALKRIQIEGHGYFSEHFDISPANWTMYYLYALERYQSFREATNGQIVKDPIWYRQGVEYLKAKQQEDGSWKNEKGNDGYIVADTAFASLFLLRSMKKSIERAQAFGAGRMAGGQRLPLNLQQAQQRDSRLVQPWKETNAKNVLAIVKNPEHPDFASCLDHVPELAQLFKTQRVDVTQTAQAALIASYDQAPAHSRILILRIIGQLDDLKHTPVLIEALEDESLQVRREALDNLERLSKRLSPLGASALNQPDERAKLVQDWKDWYSSLAVPRTSAVPVPVSTTSAVNK